MQELERQFKADGGTFEEYRMGELFVIRNNPQLDKVHFSFSENAQYPYFTRTENNNGILGYVDYLDDNHLIKGNSLAIGMISMLFHYMSHDFYAGQFTKTAFPKFDGFNETIALYFIPLLCKFQKIYQGVLVRDFEQTFYDSIVSLPTLNGKISFPYMESVIRELQDERISKLAEYLKESGLENTELSKEEKDAVQKMREDDVEWKEFKVGELFEYLKAPYLGNNPRQENVSRKKTTEFNTPVICAKRGDNGIMYWGRKNDFTTYGNVLSVIYNGAIAAGLVYAQKDSVGVFTDSYLIRHKNNDVTFLHNLFLKTSLQKVIFEKYTRELKAVWKRISEDNILLPITPDGEIDWDFMQNLISAESRLAIRGVVKWMNKSSQVKNYEVGHSADSLAADPPAPYGN